MNCIRKRVFTTENREYQKSQIIRGIFQFRRKSLFGNSNGDVSPVFAWWFWSKFLAMGSTGSGAALGCFQLIWNSSCFKKAGCAQIALDCNVLI
jgi:hypothetical protein